MPTIRIGGTEYDLRAKCEHCGDLMWFHQDARGRFDPCDEWPEDVEP